MPRSTPTKPHCVESEQRGPVGLADLARAERSRLVVELVARGQHANDRALMDDHIAPTETGGAGDTVGALDGRDGVGSGDAT